MKLPLTANNNRKTPNMLFLFFIVYTLYIFTKIFFIFFKENNNYTALTNISGSLRDSGRQEQRVGDVITGGNIAINETTSATHFLKVT